MTDETPPVTTDQTPPAQDPTPTPPPAPTPGPAPTSSHTGLGMDELRNELKAFGEQMVTGIREAFPAPVQTAPPKTETPPETPPKPKDDTPPAHPVPGNHGGGKLAAWWFGSKR